jgi:tetratricopeptide (TPR) repeat protein
MVDVTKPMPTKFGELMSEGKKLASAGKYGDAKLMFDAALKLEKKNATVHVELARMYISMNEKGPAVASANKAVKLAPLSTQAWNTKGRAELAAHKYDEAIEAFSKAVELDETNVFAWNNLGYTELLLKRYEDAASHLQEATGRPGATGYMFNNLGTALEQLDNLDDARVAYESGGTLGSKEAASSRKRLEGVDSIAIAVVEPASAVHAETPKIREYELVNESDVEEDSASPASSNDEDDAADAETQPGDNATL